MTMPNEVKLLPCARCGGKRTVLDVKPGIDPLTVYPEQMPCPECTDGTWADAKPRPTIVTDEVVEPVGVLAEVREQLATLADKQADQRGDYLYRGQPDTWLLEAIRKLDTAIAAMPAIVGGQRA